MQPRPRRRACRGSWNDINFNGQLDADESRLIFPGVLSFHLALGYDGDGGTEDGRCTDVAAACSGAGTSGPPAKGGGGPAPSCAPPANKIAASSASVGDVDFSATTFFGKQADYRIYARLGATESLTP